jgi:hypothetical protein
MTLTKNEDGTYTCNECLFVFGQDTLSKLGDGFGEYHTRLHAIVMTNRESNVPERFKDISNGE